MVGKMSSAAIPRSARLEDRPADPLTTFTAGQKKAVRVAVNYCSVVDPTIADLESLLETVEKDLVLIKKERRRFQDVFNKHSRQRLDTDERRLNAWARSDLWDAHRAEDDLYWPQYTLRRLQHCNPRQGLSTSSLYRLLVKFKT